MLKFIVDENPKPLKRHRMTLTGHVYDPSSKDKMEWLQKAQINCPEEPFEGPISIDLNFFMKRPKSHFRTGKNSHLLKKSAPIYCSQKPDLDNLAKFVLDAMNGSFYTDDAQIIKMTCCKVFDDKNGYSEITIGKEGIEYDSDSSF